jgi:hypothetical protein
LVKAIFSPLLVEESGGLAVASVERERGREATYSGRTTSGVSSSARKKTGFEKSGSGTVGMKKKKRNVKVLFEGRR